MIPEPGPRKLGYLMIYNNMDKLIKLNGLLKKARGEKRAKLNSMTSSEIERST